MSWCGQVQEASCSSDDEEWAEGAADEEIYTQPRPLGVRWDGALEWLEGCKYFGGVLDEQIQCNRCSRGTRYGWVQDRDLPLVFCRRCMPSLVEILGH